MDEKWNARFRSHDDAPRVLFTVPRRNVIFELLPLFMVALESVHRALDPIRLKSYRHRRGWRPHSGLEQSPSLPLSRNVKRSVPPRVGKKPRRVVVIPACVY